MYIKSIYLTLLGYNASRLLHRSSTMLLTLLHSTLILFTAPYKHHPPTTQQAQILQNYQPESPTPAASKVSSSTAKQQDTAMPSATPTAVQQPPNQEKIAGKDTGFPEPLSPDRNTTLPHPDADTSKNATIEGADVPLSKVHSRRSLRGHGRNHSSRSGKITAEEGLRYDNIQYADGSKESTGESKQDSAAKFVDAPADGEVKQEQTLDGAKEGRGEEDAHEAERKKGLLKKLHMQK